MVFPLDDNFVFGDNFFSWLIIFFSPKATKKITQLTKKNYSPTNEVTHPTETPICLWYDVFMPLPSPWKFLKISFLKIPHKMRPYQAIFNWSLFNFFFSTEQESYFFFTTLDFFFILKFKNHDFVNKKRGRWYKSLIVIFFSKKLIFKICLLGNNLRKKNINI